MADSTALLDPKYPLTPDQFAESERLKLEGDYPAFDPTLTRFRPQAEGELQPYYQSLFRELGTMQEQAQTRRARTYDDLVSKLKNQYNQRGTFFSGEALGAEQRLAEDSAAEAMRIDQGFDTRRAGAATDMTDRVLRRSQELQQQAFDEYQTVRKGTIEKQVAQKLADYIPGYAGAVQKQIADQIADENNPWVEIPLESGIDYPTETAAAPTTTPTATARPSGAAYKIHSLDTWKKVGSQFDKSETTSDKGKGIWLTDAAYKARYVGPKNKGKYKPSELIQIGKDFFLKKGVKKR